MIFGTLPITSNLTQIIGTSIFDAINLKISLYSATDANLSLVFYNLLKFKLKNLIVIEVKV